MQIDRLSEHLDSVQRVLLLFPPGLFLQSDLKLFLESCICKRSVSLWVPDAYRLCRLFKLPNTGGVRGWCVVVGGERKCHSAGFDAAGSLYDDQAVVRRLSASQSQLCLFSHADARFDGWE